MSKSKDLFLAAAALFLFSAGLSAADNVLLALRAAPAQAEVIKTAELLAPATAQAPVTELQPGDFDALSAVNDPLYREGSKEFLKETVKQDELKAQERAVKPALRDAPADIAVPAVPAVKPVYKKFKAKKPVHADPLEVKDTL